MDIFEKFIEKYGEHVILGDWSMDESGVTKGDLYFPQVIAPVKMYRNVDSELFMVELAFISFDKIYTVIVPMETIASTNSIIKLANYGVEVHSLNAVILIRYLADVLNSSEDCMELEESRSVMGWLDRNTFLPYSDKYTFDASSDYGTLYADLTQKGELEEWIRTIGPLRKASLPFRLCIAASFASVLIEPIGENPFIYHLWGGTGSGKTVALMCAMSIWGNPDQGHLLRTLNMTPNALASTAAFLKNIPFGGDELQCIKTYFDNYDRLIMSICEGIERTRMQYSKVNDTRSWKCSFLFTGEEPCTRNDSGGGAKNRVIEVECREPLLTNGNYVSNFCRKNYGTAGKAFVEALYSHEDPLEDYDPEGLYQTYMKGILENSNTTVKQAGAMALILAADNIASCVFWQEDGFLVPSDVICYLKRNEDIDVSENAYKYLCDSIAENINSFDQYAVKTWGILNADENRAFIISNTLSSVLQSGGYDLNAVKSRWADRGYILKSAKNRFTETKRIKGVPAACYCVVLPEKESS